METITEMNRIHRRPSIDCRRSFEPANNMKSPRSPLGLRFLFLLQLIVLSLFGSYNAKATILELSGDVSYHIADDEHTVILDAERLSNLSSWGISGTINLELWAFSQPYSGSGAGYQLASEPLGELYAGEYFYDIHSGPIHFVRPPPGVWYFALLAREFVAGPGDGFVTRDYVNFSSPMWVAGGAYAEDVEFFGATQWTIHNNGTVQMQVEKLENTCDLGTTGSLRLDVWATASPYTGGSVTGYRFGTMPLNPLPARYAYNHINQTVAYQPPPDGYYYVTMTISEYKGGQFKILDYVTGPTLRKFGNPPPPLPSAPSSLTATKGSLTTGVSLTWSSSTGATSYEVYRSTSNSSSSSALIAEGLTGTTYLDSSAAVAVTYYYWVKAKNVSGKSNFSPVASGYRNGTAPTITLQPKAQNGIIGYNVTFSVGVTGTAPLTYQWRKDGFAIQGKTGANLTLVELEPDDAGTYSVHISNGYGNVTSASVPLVVYDPEPLKTLYWQGEDRRLALWYMNGTNKVTSMLLRDGRTPAAGWNLRAFGDFNGDSKTDLVLQHTDGGVATWLMDGPVHLGSVALRTPGFGWRVTGAADMNQDSKPDLLLRHTDGRLVVWYMDGTMFLSAAFLKNGQPISLQWRLVGTADFNSDNHNDLLWHNKDGRVLVWLMNGTELTSTLFLRNGAPTPAGVRLAAIVDINNDASADLIWQTPDRRLTSWLMQETELVRGLPLQNGQPVGSGWKLVGPK